MSEVLNIDRLHRNGKAELEVGIRNTGFIIKRDSDTDDIVIFDLKNRKMIEFSSYQNMIENLHFYCNKDIVINESLFTIDNAILSINCTEISDGKLVIPYTLSEHKSITVIKPETVTKIIIPRGFNLINNNIIMTDEDLAEIFPNLKIIVRIHEDGAVLSYNIETAELN